MTNGGHNKCDYHYHAAFARRVSVTTFLKPHIYKSINTQHGKWSEKETCHLCSINCWIVPLFICLNITCRHAISYCNKQIVKYLRYKRLQEYINYSIIRYRVSIINALGFNSFCSNGQYSGTFWFILYRIINIESQNDRWWDFLWHYTHI